MRGYTALMIICIIVLSFIVVSNVDKEHYVSIENRVNCDNRREVVIDYIGDKIGRASCRERV